MQTKEQSAGQETVLLRYPTPKYNFQGRKLAKTPSEVTNKSSTNLVQETGLTTEISRKKNGDLGLKSEKDAKNVKRQETRSQNIGSSHVIRNTQTSSLNPGNNICQSSLSSGNGNTPSSLNSGNNNAHQTFSQQPNVSVTSRNNPEVSLSNTANISQSGIASVDKQPVCINCHSTKVEGHHHHDGHTEQTAIGMSSSSSQCLHQQAKYVMPAQGESQFTKWQRAMVSNSGEHLKLQKENESLRSQLDIQLKVNSELKKLLIASVGDELETRVERLARDKAELSEEVGGYTKKVTEDYENLDKISIQADMWRSKFLASRVMVDELASGRAFYAMQYQESQYALQQLLMERHELRAHLLECYKVLQQVKGAFDPLNTHKSSQLPSTNVIDLSKQAHQLAEAIRFRLLPGQLNLQTVIDIDTDNEMTHAESFAQELVSKPVNADMINPSPSFKLFGPEPSRIERFHPEQNFENLTFYCCAQCKGEISVV